MINRTLFSISLLIWGLFSLLIYFRIINLNSNLITALILIAYGLSSTNSSFKNSNRIQLVVSSIVFFIGILLLVKINYPIIESRGLVLVSVFLISGAVSLILFIDNTSQKVFLYSGILIFLIGILLSNFLYSLGIISLINKTAMMFERYWAILLIVLGVITLAKKIY